MNSTVNYLIEVNVALIFFYGVYALLLKNENEFSFSRFFLLGGMLLSLVLPLFHLPVLAAVPTMKETFPAYWLPEISTGQHAPLPIDSSATTFGFWETMTWTYLGIAFLLTTFFICRITKIALVFLHAETYSWNACRIVESKNDPNIFSFFRFIFIGQSAKLTVTEKDKVLQHELVHVDRFHSFDIMFVNVVHILCWFNPILLLYKKTLVQLHEFEADARSVDESAVDTYCELMARMALEHAGFPLVNHFHNSLTLKRITMMKTLKRKIQPWKLATLLALLPVIFFVVSCQDQVAADFKTVTDNSGSAADIPPQVAKWIEANKSLTGKDYNVLELNQEGYAALKKLNISIVEVPVVQGVTTGLIVKTDDPSHFQLNTTTGNRDLGPVLNSLAVGGRIFVMVEKGKKADELSNLSASQTDVHQFAQTQPQFVGGADSLRLFISNNVKYPAQARKDRIEGKVFVQFIIETDGSVSNVEVIKGIGADCDKEALRVVTMMPKWSPGKMNDEAVRVKFCVPVYFKLS